LNEAACWLTENKIAGKNLCVHQVKSFGYANKLISPGATSTLHTHGLVFG